MKIVFFTLLLALAVLFGNAQNIKPYQAILQTKSGKLKGILQQVDSAKIVLNIDGQLLATNIADIQTVKIRKTNKRYKAKNYLGKMPETEYKLDQHGQFVDKWGNKAPSLGDEVLGAGYNAFFNGLINAIAFPIHAINPNLAKFNLEKQDAAQLNQLSYYSIQYQSSPANRVADLKKISEISAKAKQ